MPDRQVGVQKGKNQRLFFFNDGFQDSRVQKSPGVDGHSGFETEPVDDIEEFGEVFRSHGDSDIDIHRNALNSMEHAGHSTADDKIDFGIEQCSEDLFVVAQEFFSSLPG